MNMNEICYHLSKNQKDSQEFKDACRFYAQDQKYKAESIEKKIEKIKLKININLEKVAPKGLKEIEYQNFARFKKIIDERLKKELKFENAQLTQVNELISSLEQNYK